MEDGVEDAFMRSRAFSSARELGDVGAPNLSRNVIGEELLISCVNVRNNGITLTSIMEILRQFATKKVSRMERIGMD